jgi:hypothetical protein
VNNTCAADPGFCANDAACGIGRICVNAVCTSGCRNDDGCSGLQTCDVASLSCREPAMCAGDIDCFSPRVCTLGACQAPNSCVLDAECGPGLRCNAMTRQCEAFFGCANNAECGQGFTCSAGACVENQGCMNDQNCVPGDICSGNRCVASQCANLPLMQPGVAQNGLLVGAFSSFTPACNPANVPNAGDSALRFVLAAPATVTFEALGTAVTLALSADCETVNLQTIACGTPAALGAVNLPAGEYTVVIEGVNGATGLYSLTYRIAP